MPDPIFADPRLARIYDDLDADRTDLDHYESIVDELGARSVLDIGCGTGTFACRLAARGIEVVGVDPAAASLDVARAKPGAERVTWLARRCHDAAGPARGPRGDDGQRGPGVPHRRGWAATLLGMREALRPGGHLVFEVRDPRREAWRSWNPDESCRRSTSPASGAVESWVELTQVDLPLVSFRWTYRFERTGASIVSDSTLRFRERAEVEPRSTDAGFRLVDVRDAPDRPGLEHVFVAERAR